MKICFNNFSFTNSKFCLYDILNSTTRFAAYKASSKAIPY